MASVLIVEDDELLGRTLCNYCKKAGHGVFWAKKAEDVFDALLEQKVELILLDIMLPGVDGFEILKKLKAEEKYKNIPVVMLSNLSESTQIEKAMKLGAKDYVVKANIEMDDLMNKLEERFLR